jgi:uncharacterized YigZ family protein
MTNDNFYTSVAKSATAEITEKKSRFICNMCHVKTESDALSFVEKIKKEHYNAKHNVYAYILNDGTKKYTDDGEPSKTAGLPILEMLEKQSITDVVCVVTRYFGGILLGTGGLVRAYTDSAKAGLLECGTVTMEKCDVFELIVPYSKLQTVEYLLSNLGAKIESKDFSENIQLLAYARLKDAEVIYSTISDTFGPSVSVVSKGQAYKGL